MSLMLVSDGDREVWVAYLDAEARTYTYLEDTGKFHFNSGVFRDYGWDRDNDYSELTVAEAKEKIAAGVGKAPEGSDIVAMLSKEPTLSADEVFAAVEAEAGQG